MQNTEKQKSEVTALLNHIIKKYIDAGMFDHLNEIEKMAVLQDLYNLVHVARHEVFIDILKLKR